MKLSCIHGHVKAIPHELMLIPRALGKLSVHNHKPTVHLKPRKITKKKINKSYSSLLNLNQAHGTYGYLHFQTSSKIENL